VSLIYILRLRQITESRKLESAMRKKHVNIGRARERERERERDREREREKRGG
jgi:hypothetical protein